MKSIDMRPLFAAMIALLLLAGCAAPAPAATSAPAATVAQPSMPPAEAEGQPSPAPDSSLETFTSERYGYTVAYSKDDWTVTETEGEWDPGTLIGSRPGTDIFSARDVLVITLAAQPVTDGMTAEQWADSLLKIISDSGMLICNPPEAMESTTMGGEPAAVNSVKCSDGWSVISVSTIHNGKGYWLQARSSTGDHSADWPHLEEFLSTFTFTG